MILPLASFRRLKHLEYTRGEVGDGNGLGKLGSGNVIGYAYFVPSIYVKYWYYIRPS
jgi:hypothetical protein